MSKKGRANYRETVTDDRYSGRVGLKVQDSAEKEYSRHCPTTANMLIYLYFITFFAVLPKITD